MSPSVILFCYFKKVTKKPIVYAFIDSQNLNLGILSQGWKLSWPKLRHFPNEHYSSLLRKFNQKKYIVKINQLRNSLEK